MELYKHILRPRLLKNYIWGRNFYKNAISKEVEKKTTGEISKRPLRTEVINFLLALNKRETYYLEIGVRNPNHNYNQIISHHKFSVDPGVEFGSNPVDFAMTSDDFFAKLSNSEILSENIRFDVIFIDGLHLAEQVDRDIINSLKFIKDEGFIVLHDCNPPTEWHAREQRQYWLTPAKSNWNGTTWKAFFKWRCNAGVYSCCIDSDWGIGILSKNQKIGKSTMSKNPFFEFKVLDNNRKESLNLIEFETLKELLSQL